MSEDKKPRDSNIKEIIEYELTEFGPFEKSRKVETSYTSAAILEAKDKEIEKLRHGVDSAKLAIEALVESKNKEIAELNDLYEHTKERAQSYALDLGAHKSLVERLNKEISKLKESLILERARLEGEMIRNNKLSEKIAELNKEVHELNMCLGYRDQHELSGNAIADWDVLKQERDDYRKIIEFELDDELVSMFGENTLGGIELSSRVERAKAVLAKHKKGEA